MRTLASWDYFFIWGGCQCNKKLTQSSQRTKSLLFNLSLQHEVGEKQRDKNTAFILQVLYLERPWGSQQNKEQNLGHPWRYSEQKQQPKMPFAFPWLASWENGTQNNFLIHHFSRLVHIFYKTHMNIQVYADGPRCVEPEVDTSKSFLCKRCVYI